MVLGCFFTKDLKKFLFNDIIILYVKNFFFGCEYIFMKRLFNDVKKFWNYTCYSSKSDLKSEVAGSFLSWLWWILDPLLYMIVYSFVSIFVFGAKEKYFLVFVFIGLTCWQFFSKTFKAGVKLVQKKKSIVTKVYIPKFIFVLEQIGLYGFKMLVSFGLTILLMIYYRVPVSFKMLWVLPLLILLGIITFALTTIVSHFGVFVEDLLNIVTVALQLGFYLSGIFYSIETRISAKSEILGNVLLICNPIALIMQDMRNVLIYNTNPHYLALGIWLILGLLLSAISVKIIYKYENSYVKII